jgi:nicotinamidase/pyrazinamidase
MLEGPLVFVDIDTQRDFLEPSGALFVQGSEEILPNLQRLTAFARSHGIPILATSCAHHPEDKELTIFPPHCMAGSPGQRRVEATECGETVVLDIQDRLAGELPTHLTVLKRELDLFSRPDADELIARYDQKRPLFVVYGVATDYCVKAAVAGLLRRNCKVAVVVDAVRAIDQAAENAILTDQARRGALMVMTERVCGPS